MATRIIAAAIGAGALFASLAALCATDEPAYVQEIIVAGEVGEVNVWARPLTVRAATETPAGITPPIRWSTRHARGGVRF